MGHRAPEVVWAEVHGESVLHHRGTGSLTLLDPVATAVWSVLGDQKEDDLVALLSAQFAAPPERVRADVRRLLAELAEGELLVHGPD